MGGGRHGRKQTHDRGGRNGAGEVDSEGGDSEASCDRGEGFLRVYEPGGIHRGQAGGQLADGATGSTAGESGGGRDAGHEGQSTSSRQRGWRNEKAELDNTLAAMGYDGVGCGNSGSDQSEDDEWDEDWGGARKWRRTEDEEGDGPGDGRLEQRAAVEGARAGDEDDGAHRARPDERGVGGVDFKRPFFWRKRPLLPTLIVNDPYF